MGLHSMMRLTGGHWLNFNERGKMTTTKENIRNCRNELIAIAEEIRTSPDINYLIDNNLEMRQRQFYIQEQEALAYSNLMNARNVREVFEKRSISDKINEGMSGNKAELLTRSDSQGMRAAENALEAEHNDWKGLRFTVDSFCDAAQQKIAALRKEHEVESMRQN